MYIVVLKHISQLFEERILKKMDQEPIQDEQILQQKSDDIFQQRTAKMQELAAAGLKPYGSRVDGVISSVAAKATFVPDTENTQEITVAGRIVSFRIMGKSIFAHIKDQEGKLQTYAQRDVLGEDEFKRYKKLDIGDIIAVTGHLFVTRTGEITLKVASYRLLSKSLRPLPEKWHGLTNTEQRYRQRYLDLIMNDESRTVFKKRAAIVREIRNYLDSKGYMEVETPMLQNIPGGAAATPFVTHYNALNTDVYLRIATELSLKKLLVGGFEKVYEINRNFRNEGMDRKHNPEFT